MSNLPIIRKTAMSVHSDMARSFVQRQAAVSAQDCAAIAEKVDEVIDFRGKFTYAHVVHIFRLFPYTEFLFVWKGVQNEIALKVFLDCLSTLLCGVYYDGADDRFHELMKQQFKIIFKE